MIIATKARIGGYQFDANLSYDVTRPDVITVLFLTRTPVMWILGRDLLADGLMNPAGEGDVRIAPSPATDEVAVEIRTRHGRAFVRLLWDPVAGFVRATYGRVPRGTEYANVDWDQLLPAAGGGS
ncbi:SsgA family sporulation/cell division regulator [Amycolatopsis sp., V23-08]|uniref:SsgA family sporulation/cell division regulator n=1 Tax=Amycolatopsis heterodermiae TaxID=3110235 RepID=A0ABU5RIE2_9PSEU|nr:SsgA family sporulation/cell division regulator [Amycolatopsis sp., V23-08]MEA5366053.1 SsgA family sporulation/cell division regulator [Amycolatopsis sp., V23-08]